METDKNSYSLFCLWEKGYIKSGEMNLIVNMACGLANRMFQYSYYLFLKKQGYSVSVDFYHSAKLAHEKVDWNSIFPTAKIEQASRVKVFWLGGGADILSKIRRKYFPTLTKVAMTNGAFDVFKPCDIKKERYLLGVFLNAEVVEAVESEVKGCFSFQPFKDIKNILMEKEMKNCNSVAIHVRKGKDYQERIWYQNTCSMEYYHKAINMIKTRIDNPRFYIFTDNPQWVKDNFKEIDFTLVEGNPAVGYGSHFDMQLMSICKHNIISNSTYSWWSAFLNNNKDKIVIIPKIWFNPSSCKDYTSGKALCRGWIAL